MTKSKKNLIIGIICIGIPIIVIASLFYYFSLIFTPEPSYNTIRRISKQEINELNYIADYFYNLEFDDVRKDTLDPIEIINVKKSEGVRFEEKRIESPEFIQKLEKFFTSSDYTWYNGFSFIEKTNGCVSFQKWATMDSGIYIVYSPLGEESIQSAFAQSRTLEIISLDIDNWYYCYSSSHDE